MKTRKFAKELIATLALSSVLTLQQANAGTVIDAWPDPNLGATFGVISPFGEILGTDCCNYINSYHDFATYYGQTFVAPSGIAETLTFNMFHMSSSGTDGIDFRLLIAETAGSGAAIYPTNVIYESGVYTSGPVNGLSGTVLPQGTVTLNIGGLDLIDGTTYAWVLDTISTADGLQGYGGMSLRHPGLQPDFSGGMVHANFDLEYGIVDAQWHYWSGYDLAYRMEFSDGGVAEPTLEVLRTLPVHEPSPLVLLGVGIVGLTVSRWRRLAIN